MHVVCTICRCITCADSACLVYAFLCKFQARNRQAMNEIRKVINWAQQAPAPSTLNSPVAAHHGRGRERQQQLPGSPTAALTAEEHFVDEGFGTAPGSSAFAGSNSSSHSSGGSSSRSRVGSGGGAGQLAPGLPGPVGDCLPLMLEEVELSMPLSSLLGAKRLSDGAGSCGGAAAAGPGDGDGLVAVTVGGGSGNRPSRSKGSNGSKGRLPDAEVSGVGSGLHEAQEGSYQEVQQLFSEESRGDVGSDCSRWVVLWWGCIVARLQGCERCTTGERPACSQWWPLCMPKQPPALQLQLNHNQAAS